MAHVSNVPADNGSGVCITLRWDASIFLCVQMIKVALYMSLNPSDVCKNDATLQ